MGHATDERALWEAFVHAPLNARLGTGYARALCAGTLKNGAFGNTTQLIWHLVCVGEHAAAVDICVGIAQAQHPAGNWQHVAGHLFGSAGAFERVLEHLWEAPPSREPMVA